MKNFKYIVILLSLFFFNIKTFMAYTCTYTSSQVVTDSTKPSGERTDGCGQFSLNVSNKGVIDTSSLKFSNSSMGVYVFSIHQSWNDFVNSSYDGSYCPEAYSGLNANGTCNIYLGIGTLGFSYPTDGYNYTFDYGKNSNYASEDEEEEEPAPSAGDEIYIISGALGHNYYNATECTEGYTLKNIYVDSLDKVVKGCVASKQTGDFRMTGCTTGSAASWSGIKMENGERTDGTFHIVACENTNMNQNAGIAYSCVYSDTVCGEITAYRDLDGNVTFESGSKIKITQNISKSLFGNNKSCPTLYLKNSNNTCDIIDKDASGYTLARGSNLNEHLGIVEPIQNVHFPDVNDCRSLLGDPAIPGSPAYYLVFAFKVVRYVAIILLIALSVMEFVTATASSDQEAITKATKKTIRRFVLCVVIFALPTLLNFSLNFLYDRKMEVCGITQQTTQNNNNN